MTIDPFKARVIELALDAVAAHGFALAGGNALAAHGSLSRPTQDIDLFTPLAGATGQVLDAVRNALAADGYAVHVLRAAADGDFAELHVSRDGQTTQLDLGRDWRAHHAALPAHRRRHHRPPTAVRVVAARRGQRPRGPRRAHMTGRKGPLV